MRVLVVALFSLVVGCSVLPQEAYRAEQAITLPDGTTAAAGQPVYVDREGRATASPVGADGAPNKPLMVADADRIERVASGAGSITGALPPPFGWLAGLAVTVLGAGSVAGARAYRRRQLSEAGVPAAEPQS